MQFGYAKGEMELDLSTENLLGVLTPNPVRHTECGARAVLSALDAPIGAPPLERLVHPGMKVVIITSDVSRPMPTWVVLPPVLERLQAGGVQPSDVTVVFALGSHRGHTPEEKAHLLGDLYGKVRAVDSDPDDVVHLGVTTAGTPVDIFRTVVEADFVLCMGNIEYHYFAGYSGGVKALMPGVSTPAAIQANHRMMTDARAYAGNLDSPVRRDLEECLRFCPVHYLVNVVLDEHKQVIHAVAGDVIQAHRAGCDFLDAMYKISLPQRADIVVVSPGGYPKDQNMYQAQKALDNAKHAVRDGGAIVWLAACNEGLGSATFQRWMTTIPPQQMAAEIRRHFELGGHKAAAIAAVMARARIYLVSQLPADFVKGMGFYPASSAAEAFAAAKAYVGGERPSVYAMPYGGSTLPVCAG